MTRRATWPTRLMATVTIPSAMSPPWSHKTTTQPVACADDDRDQAVVQEIEALQGNERSAERVHRDGDRHVEREEEQEEPRLAHQVLGNARDEIGEEDRKDHDTGEREDPEDREAQERGIDRRLDPVVVPQLQMPADEGDGGAGKPQLEDLEEGDERADERPDPVAEDAQLVGEDRRRDEPGQHDGRRQHVVRRDVAADARLLGPPAR